MSRQTIGVRASQRADMVSTPTRSFLTERDQARQAEGFATGPSLSRPGDRLEKEADRVASRIVRADATSPFLPVHPKGKVTEQTQRQCDKCREEEEDDLLQAKELPNKKPLLTGDMTHQVRASIRGGQPLADSERSFFETRFGSDFSRVRVHSDQRAAKAAHHLRARAFTLGEHIVFGSGQYRTETAEGRHLLAHELTHVVQQGAASRSAERSAGEKASSTISAGPSQIMRAPCTQSNRDQGGLGQLLIQDWFVRHNPGGGQWFREFETANGGSMGGQGFADLVWDSPTDVYVYEMKKSNYGPADVQQVRNYRDAIATECKMAGGGATSIFNGRTIRRGTVNVLPVEEIPHADPAKFIDLRVSTPTGGVLVYDEEDIANVAGGTNLAGASATDRDTFQTTVFANINHLAAATAADANLAPAYPMGALAATQELLWRWLLHTN